MADEEDTEQTEQVETQAREDGWVPKEEFKGKEDDWVPAQEWIERGKAVAPIVARLQKELEQRDKKSEQQLAKLQKRFDDTIADLSQKSAAALKRQRDQIEAKYDREKEKAVKLGDEEAYDAAKKAEKAELKALNEEAEEKADTKGKDKAGGDIPAELKSQLEDWLEDNDWYTSSKVMGKRFDAFYAEVEEDVPGLSVKERLDEAKDRLVNAYPEKFGKKKGASRVEGTSGRDPGGAGNGADKNGWGDVPAEDRKQGLSFIKDDGLFLSTEARKQWQQTGEIADKEMSAAQKRYADSYFSQEKRS